MVFRALLLVGATILGSTVLREPIASAAQVVSADITSPLDAEGNVAVHEQGTVPTQQAGEPLSVRLVGLDGVTGYTVPVGKRLVIQYVNGTTAASDGHLQLGVEVAGGGSQAVYNLQSLSPPGSILHPISDPVLIFAGPGETVRLLDQNDDVRINGYLQSA